MKSKNNSKAGIRSSELFLDDGFYQDSEASQKKTVYFFFAFFDIIKNPPTSSLE